MLVGREQDGPLERNLADDFLRVARGADDVAQRFYLGAAINVADRKMIGITLAKLPEQMCRAAIGQRTACIQVREQDKLAWIQNLGRLGHEQHSGKDDYIRLGCRGLLGELQAVAYKIRQVLNLRILVIMRQDDGIHLALEPPDL